MLSGLRNNNCTNDVKYPANCQSRVGGENDSDKMYQPKPDKKIVRFVTVIGYVFSVSFGAILLSLYYLFIWNPYSHKEMMKKTTTTTTTTTTISSLMVQNLIAAAESKLTDDEISEQLPRPEALIKELNFEKKMEEMAEEIPYDLFVKEINSNSRKNKFTNVKEWKKNHRLMVKRSDIP